MKLTNEQAEMASLCLERGDAWVTGVKGRNYELLLGWQERGWVRAVEPPEGLHSLASFVFTDAGRAALQTELAP